MTTSRLVHAITLLAVFAMAARISVDTDTWWHLRAGEWILENRAILQVDVFSYTRAGAPWNYPGWLVELPMYLIYSVFGPGGLNLWTAAMVTLAFAFVWPALSGGVFLRAFTVVLAAAASGVYWAARPYLVTFVLAAVFVWVLEDFRWRDRDRLWLLPLLMIVWANSHGGFAVGIILIGIYGLDFTIRWLGDRFYPGGRAQETHSVEQSGLSPKLRKLFLIGLLTLAAVAINPSGPRMLLYPINTVSIGGLQDFIAEWQSPNFHETRVQPFLLLLLLTFGAVGSSGRRIQISDFLLVAVFTTLSLVAARNIALFAITAPLVLTRHAALLISLAARRFGLKLKLTSGSGQSRIVGMLNLVILAVLLAAVLIKAASVYPEPVNTAYFDETYPTAAVAYLNESNPEGRLFNSYNWGGYLVWSLPDYPVFIDGRTDLFNDELIDAWIQVIRAEDDWEDVIRSWDVHLVLLEPSYPLASQLRAEHWNILHEDAISVLFEKP
ncbi:MAG: hypothetical protein R3335_10430 [Anaerolineales bacterium]|nr:hypothetical protein [Anaerolineales bacterium]